MNDLETLKTNEPVENDVKNADAELAWLDCFMSERPEMPVVVEWLHRNGCEPLLVIRAALARLVERGRYLSRRHRDAYAAKVLLGEFFARWARKYQGATVEKLQKRNETREAEVRPFEFALMAIGTERTFTKVIPRLAREKVVRRGGGSLGNPQDFSCFVTTHGGALAHRFLANFNPNVFNAAAKSVKYLEVAAVSYYLHDGKHVTRDRSGLGEYLKQSTRLDKRTKLAVKLANDPSLLTTEERETLRLRYRVKGTVVRRMKVKDVASLLGYPSADTLSKKFNRVLQWMQNREAAAVEKAMKEMPF